MKKEEKTYEVIGRMLLHCQRLERMLLACLMLSYDRSGSQAQLRRLLDRDKETLGSLFKKLRAVLDLPSDFESRLDSFLEGRNLLVHRLTTEEWVDFSSLEGLGRLQDFLNALQVDASFVARILLAFAMSFQQQGDAISPEIKEFLNSFGSQIARTCTAKFADLPENYFGTLHDEVKENFFPQIKPTRGLNAS